ncbi:MAG: outer membrane lipoprotein-sorting protein [Nitrospirae bacterium]|nr:outer membrane lipoprotein-sorting protein [Nitrospirota bacterium]
MWTRTFLVILCLLTLPPAFAEELTVDHIVERAKQNEFPDNMSATIKMVLRDKEGNERLREFQIKRRGQGDDGDAVIRFVAPPEVEGTAFLMKKEKDKDAEIYMFIPELKRTRRIAGAESNRSFVGSDFSYSDIQLSHFSKGTHRNLRSEAIDGADCHVVESSIPKTEDEPYDRIVAWIRKDNFLPVQVLFYSGSDQPKKKFTIQKFEKQGQTLVVTDSTMQTVQKGHTTQMQLRDLKLGAPLKDSEFTLRALERG